MKRKTKPKPSARQTKAIRAAGAASKARPVSASGQRGRRGSVTPPHRFSGAALKVTTAIRAWVEARGTRRKRTTQRVAWRPQKYGQRVLVFDLETTIDTAQRLLFGFFRLYDNDRLVREGIIAADILDYDAMKTIAEYAARCRLPIYSREKFVEEVFYPEVYLEGTLCIGFNLPFDLARIALHAGCGKTKNRRKFRIVLTRRLRWHDLRIESLSGRAAFIGFVPKRPLYRWERPFFSGRFCDLSTLAGAFSGKRLSLKSAGKAFRAHTRKMNAPEFGTIDRHSLLYGRQDVRATWALYKALRAEYRRHPFATFENEQNKPETGLHMGRLFSGASIAKQYLRLLNIAPLLVKQPRFLRRYLGRGAAAYFGGRANVGVRKIDVPIRVTDFTSMYPSVVCLQELQKLLVAPKIRAVNVTSEIRQLVQALANAEDPSPALFDPKNWRTLNCLVQVDPNGAILPVRFRANDEDPYSIAVTPLHTPQPRWYTLADVLGSIVLGGPAPKIRRAIRFVPEGRSRPRSTKLRGQVELRSDRPIFKTIVEQRQIAKRGAKQNPELAALEMGLKIVANSGGYGIYAEVNVKPGDPKKPIAGEVFSDIVFEAEKVHVEEPGDFANPILAALITGGARLMLALLEREVTSRGGTYAFCDTDSLAIVCGSDCPDGIPCLPESTVWEIVARFDALNPYDPAIVPHLLKVEYPKIDDLRCFAVSAKRYVLYRWRGDRRIEIVKASESALGAIIGRSVKETTRKLARRVWLSILLEHVDVNSGQRHRARLLTNFDVPLRRKFPISQPAVLQRLDKYNHPRTFEQRVKPFGFVQSLTPVSRGKTEALPIAPFELDLAKAKKLPWIDFNSGRELRIDWHGTSLDGTLAVMRLSDYIYDYARHPEAKAADQNGTPAHAETTGVLRRLRLQCCRIVRIGKEVDRLGDDDGAALGPDRPFEYEYNNLAEDIAYLAQFPQAATAAELEISERGWRKIIKGMVKPLAATAERIQRAAIAMSSTPLSDRVIE